MTPRWRELLRRALPSPKRSTGAADDTWHTLRPPVPGHTVVDGVPVAVVAVRSNSRSGLLEVVRGTQPPGETGAGRAGVRRHTLAARSFNPHPRRELTIAGERFFYGTVSNGVRCADCGRDDHGFGFISFDADHPGASLHSSSAGALCERCAQKRAVASRAGPPK